MASPFALWLLLGRYSLQKPIHVFAWCVNQVSRLGCIRFPNATVLHFRGLRYTHWSLDISLLESLRRLILRTNHSPCPETGLEVLLHSNVAAGYDDLLLWQHRNLDDLPSGIILHLRVSNFVWQETTAKRRSEGSTLYLPAI